MSIHLKTVIFRNHVEIDNVPVFSCDECAKSEIYPAIKPELIKLISEKSQLSEKQHLCFEDYNEFATIIKKVTDKNNRRCRTDQIIEERINELLDLLLIAKSLDDTLWIEDVRSRLKQLIAPANAMY